MEQIEYDGIPIGTVYYVPDQPGFNKTTHGATYKALNLSDPKIRSAVFLFTLCYV